MKTTALSTDAQATALLVGRFGKGDVKPLTRVEFNQTAKSLHQHGMRPSDLFKGIPDELPIDRERVKALLSRGVALALAIETWGQIGIGLVSRADLDYPERFKTILKSGSTPVLYYAGNLSVLERPTISVVGSRDATEAGLRFAHGVGERAAAEGVVVVSGDARGVDRAAMEGALEHGGAVIGILADSLSKAALSKRYRQAINAGKLLLLSHVEPDARFTVAAAMERNRYLYAAGDAVIIADSDVKGGTWNGAVENLKYCWTPAFVRIGPEAREGNVALSRKGIIEISDTWLNEGRTIHSLFESTMVSTNSLPLFSNNALPSSSKTEIPNQDVLFKCFLERLLASLTVPLAAERIAEDFGLQTSQAEIWLERAASSGSLNFTADHKWQRISRS